MITKTDLDKLNSQNPKIWLFPAELEKEHLGFGENGLECRLMRCTG